MPQEETTIVSNFNLREGLPSRAQIGALDPDIFGEGQRVIMNEGDADIAFTPPPEKLTMPDWSGIKSIRKYFGRRDYQVFPAWFYHPTEEPRLMRTSDEARKKIGAYYRKATIDEKGRTGLSHVWDWEEGSLWRAHPYGVQKFDPSRPAQGKIYQASAPNPVIAQNAMIEALIPAVAAAVAQSLKATGPSAPATIDPKQWEAFLQFQAYQKAAEAVDKVKTDNALAAGPESIADETLEEEQPEMTNNLSADEQRALWAAEAERKGIKVDGRWSLDRLVAEIEKVT